MATGLVQVLADGKTGLAVLGSAGARWAVRGDATNTSDADGPLLGLTTNGNAGHIVGVETQERWYQRRWGGVLTFRIKTGSNMADVRYVVGLSSVPGAKLETPIAHLAAWIYDTGAHGTAFWRAVTSDGSGTLTTTVTTLAAANSTLTTLTIDMTDGANVKFRSGATLHATNSANLPTDSQAMQVGAWLRDLTGGGVS